MAGQYKEYEKLNLPEIGQTIVRTMESHAGFSEEH